MDPFAVLMVPAAAVFLLFFLCGTVLFVGVTGSWGRPTRWFLRWVNAKDRLHDAALAQPSTPLLPLRWATAGAIGAGLVIGPVVFPVIVQASRPMEAVFACSLVLLDVAAALGGASVYLHYRAGSNRRLKYELFSAGVASLYMAGMLAEAVIRQAGEWKALEPGEPLMTYAFALGGRLASPAVWSAGVSVLFSIVVRSRRVPVPGALPPRRVRWLYRARLLFHPITWLGVAIFTNDVVGLESGLAWLSLVALMLPCRYLIVERMKSAPILYLRSFRRTESSLLLGRVVLPAARGIAPVITVSHPLQPAEQLLNRMNLMEPAHLSRLPDAEWQAWMIERFRGAWAVIVDCTVPSEGVLWELHAAQQILPPERIVALVAQGSPPIPLPAEPVVYQLGWWAARRTRKELKRRLRVAWRTDRLGGAPTHHLHPAATNPTTIPYQAR